MAVPDINATTIFLRGLMLFVSIAISSLIIKFAAKKFGFKKTDYKPAIVTAIIAGIINFVLELAFSYLQYGPYAMYFISYSASILFYVLNLLVDLAAIKIIYNETWKNSTKAGILWWVINLIIAFWHCI
jgi:hypothetical protein